MTTHEDGKGTSIHGAAQLRLFAIRVVPLPLHRLSRRLCLPRGPLPLRRQDAVHDGCSDWECALVDELNRTFPPLRLEDVVLQREAVKRAREEHWEGRDGLRGRG